MAQVRMIAVDLDGTLLAREGRPGERNAAALRAAEAAGIAVVVATGRRHCYAMRPLREIGLGPETVLVSSNGTVTISNYGDESSRPVTEPVVVSMRLLSNPM